MGSPCADGAPQWLKALYLSAKNALLFIGWDRSDEIGTVYRCLYGTNSLGEPIIPVSSAFIQMGQNLWSAVLIFLFLPGARNQFRIK